ncbi:MAG: tetratricopeptide repeat protein [Nanoarchaeota archaeon]|nr:tetratricopeptide repeat protein [Nanoarchaeota archaeon]
MFCGHVHFRYQPTSVNFYYTISFIIFVRTTTPNKIMVHLLKHNCVDGCPATYQATQQGIAENIDTLRCHVARGVKELIEKRLVKETKSSVKGLERRRKIYLLTDEGTSYAKDIHEKIMNMKIRFRDKKGNIRETKICDIAEKLKKELDVNIIDIIRAMSPEGNVDYKDLTKKEGFVDFTENAPRSTHFYGREKEKNEIKDYLKENRKIVVVYGMPGIGKSVLLSKIIEEYKNEKNIFYYNIHEWDTLRSILKSFSDFLQRMGKRKLIFYLKSKPDITMGEIGIILEEELMKNCKNTLLVFDDTQKANREITSLFEYLREILPKTDTTLIVAGRKKPDFYDARHILHRIVGEIKLDGLDKESSRKLAGEKIMDEDIFEKIYSLTKGYPMALELIDTGKGLEKTRDMMKYVYNEVVRKLITQEKDLLFFISVYDRPVPVDMLLQNNFSYENVQELIKKCLLIEHGSEMVHPHDLLREFFYNKSPADLRIKNHRKAAEYHLKWKTDLDVIAAMYHYLKVNNQKDAVKIAVQNGERLINKGMGKEFMEVTEDIDENKITKKSDWVEILLFKGDVYRGAGGFDKSLECNKKALALSKKLGNKKQVAKAYLNTGIIQLNQADYKKAIENLQKAAEISKKIKDTYTSSKVYFYIGTLYWVTGKLDNAINTLSKSLKYAKKIDDKLLVANTTLDIGFIHGLEGKYEKSIELQMKGLKTLEKMGNKYMVARTYNNIGVTYNSMGNFKKAIEWYDKSIKISEKIGNIRGVGYGLSNISEGYAKLNRELDKAKEYTDKSLSIFSRLGEKRMIVQCHINYGVIYHRKREWDKAIKYFEASIKISRKIKASEFLSQAFFLYAEMLKQKGDFVKAKTQYQNALKCYMKLGNKEKVKEVKKELMEIEKRI